MSHVKETTRPRRQSVIGETNREWALGASLLASGSGAAMIGAILSPIGAVVGGVIGVVAAYIVEQKNMAQ